MKLAGLIAVVMSLLAFALGGTAPLGRVLLSVGLPELAAPLFRAPAWRGVALYRAGEFDDAAIAFKEAGDHFNAGNAFAFAGEYAAALESYDLAIDRGRADARANFDVLTAYYAGLGFDIGAFAAFPKREDGPSEESFVARGNARAAGTGSEVTNNNTMLGLVELDSRGNSGVRRIFDDKFIVANDRWLQQLEDVPGAFMDERIRYEYKRRVKLGLSPPEPEDPR